jgi:hypothetical protein
LRQGLTTVVPADLKVLILLPQPTEHVYYRSVTLDPAQKNV